jgi:hypothetical protein
MRRVRIEIPYSEETLKQLEENEDLAADTRPMIFPTKYPCWCSASSFTSDFWVAFAPDEGTDEYIKSLWPEWNGQYDFNDYVEKIEHSGRFPIDAEIYDIDGVARYEGKTYAQLQAEREQLSADLEARLNNPVVDEFGGKLYDIGSREPKQVAEFLAALHKRMADGLSD